MPFMATLGWARVSTGDLGRRHRAAGGRGAWKIHVLPPEGSPYRERVRRFIARDEKLIQTATDPAGRRIGSCACCARRSRSSTTRSMRRAASSWRNRFLPRRVRDEILQRQMDIR
jgi:hypothetical protein